VRGRDLGGAVLEAQQDIAKLVKVPPGSRLEWAGEFGDLQDAIGRLAITVPLSIALILLLLFVNFSSLIETLLAASVMPMALIGGIFALWNCSLTISLSRPKPTRFAAGNAAPTSFIAAKPRSSTFPSDPRI
jgi:heavy metal efflux system protein